MLRASVSWLEFLFFFASGHTLPYTWYERHFSPLTLQKPPLPLAPLEIISHSVYWLLYFYFQCLSIELFEQAFHLFMENVLLLFICSGWKPSNTISCTCDLVSEARNSVCASCSICIYELLYQRPFLSLPYSFFPSLAFSVIFLCCA